MSNGEDFDPDNPKHWRQLATHEAAHIVVALTLGLPSRSGVTIAGGHGNTSWMVPETAQEHIANVFACLAGVEAERIAGFGATADTGAGPDLACASRSLAHLGQADSMGVYLRATHDLLVAHWHEVQAVVDELIVRKTLTGDEVFALLASEPPT